MITFSTLSMSMFPTSMSISILSYEYVNDNVLSSTPVDLLRGTLPRGTNICSLILSVDIMALYACLHLFCLFERLGRGYRGRLLKHTITEHVCFDGLRRVRIGESKTIIQGTFPVR